MPLELSTFLRPLISRPRSSQQAHFQARCANLSAFQQGFGTPAKPSQAEYLHSLPPPPEIGGKDPRASWNPVALAYLGDAVWELYARRQCFFPPTRLTTYYENVTEYVRAEKQGIIYQTLRGGDFLTDPEQEVLKWGRNANVKVPKRFQQSGLHAQTYKEATAVECLVGYLYVQDPGRLHHLMCHIGLSGLSKSEAACDDTLESEMLSITDSSEGPKR